MPADFDQLILETYDGDLLYLDSTIFALSYGNFGAPPLEYKTRRGYRQDGETVIEVDVSPRSIQLTLYQAAPATREQYWVNRAALIDFFRPNRGGALTLTLREAGGNKRALKIFPSPGFVFAPMAPNESNWIIEESLTFVAYDPIWYDPTAAVVQISGVAASQLVFPITFPIVFSPDGTVYSTTINYVGNWNSYPIITLDGPYTNAIIRNVTTGISVVLFIAIGVGEQRIIDFTPGAQRVYDGSGNDQFGDLSPSPNSNLVDFNIRPHPLVSNGVNDIEITLAGGVIGSSGATIQYHARYFGI